MTDALLPSTRINLERATVLVLDDNGPIWVLTPKSGRPGHVPHADIEEAATTSGLHPMTTFSVAPSWSATRLAARGRGR